MRISPIALTTKIYRNNRTNKSDFKSNPILKNNFDTVSFKGKALSFDEIKPYKLQAFKLSNEASEHYEDSKEIVKKAYQELKVSKQAFKYTQSVLSIANKNPDEYVVSLENGNNLIIKPSFTPQGKFFTFVEVDQDSNPLRSILYFGSKDFQVSLYNGDKRDVYYFQNGEIHISKNVQGNFIESSYNFKNGKLASHYINTLAFNDCTPQKIDEAYFFNNDKLTNYSSGISCINDTIISDEKYSFCNGLFVGYYEDFKNLSDGAQTWSSSYHFKDGKFVVRLEDVKYKKNNNDAKATSAIFLNDDKDYIKSSDFLCELTPDGSITVVDNQ